MIRPDQDRGVSVVEYAAALLVVAVIVGVLVAPGIPAAVLAACKAAICRVAGDDCALAGEAAAAGARAPAAEPRPGTPARRPSERPRRPAARPPVPRPTCQPGSDLPKPGGFQLHAHNDYENRNPLEDALDNGATSVEADVYLDGDDLELRHNEHDASRGTLAETYVEALRERAEENGGRIYPGSDQPFTLVVEIKDGGPEAYDLALEQVRGLPPGVQVVFSGGEPGRSYQDWAGNQDHPIGRQPDNVFFDIAPGEGCSFPAELDPASPRYDPTYARNFATFNAEWDECEDLSQEELNNLVAKAHQAGLRVRFWGGPDDSGRLPGSPGDFVPCPGWLPGGQGCEDDGENTRDAWRRQMEAGVDYLNTNHLGHGRTWLTSCGADY
jgi:hypothetical protein